MNKALIWTMCAANAFILCVAVYLDTLGTVSIRTIVMAVAALTLIYFSYPAHRWWK